MAFSLNKQELIGQLGKDAETSFTTSNLAITKFSIATEHSKKGKDGNWENITTWHNCTAFSLAQYHLDGLKKGRKVYVSGRTEHQQYEKDGITKYFTSVIVSPMELILLDKQERSEGANEGVNGGTPKAPPEDFQELPF